MQTHVNNENTQNVQTDDDNSLKIIHWNMYGITPTNWSFKSKILKGIKADIICVNETHLLPRAKVELEGFNANLHNRTKVNENAKRGYGGVGIFIKNTLYDNFSIEVIDDEKEDILGIKLEDKTTGKELIIYSVYITPSNSTAGAPANEMYAHLLMKSYEFNLSDVFLIAGDLNGRIGARDDFIEILDPTIPKRQILDPIFQKKTTETPS